MSAQTKKFYLMVEQDQLPICNQNTGARHLSVDEILKQTERVMPTDFDRPRYRPNPYFALVLTVLSFVGLIWLVIVNL